jgi:preprotein translocase subunit SecG
MFQTLFVILLSVPSVFMILLILIQRGKGGGLAGAFGGMGGQSAFGTKAGDVFTKITVVTALIWFLLCVLVLFILKNGGAWQGGSGFGNGAPPSAPAATAPATTGEPATATVATPAAPTVPVEPAAPAGDNNK